MSFLQKKIFSLEPEIFGIDLSDLSVKILQLEKEGNIEKIRSFAAEDIPAGLIEDGKIIDKDKVAEIIHAAVKKAGPKKIRTNKVICSLPESKAFLRIISIPKMDEKEAGEAIKWEMEANIPLPIDQVCFDWQFLEGDEKGKQSVLTAAVAKDIIDDSVDVLRKSGLEVYGLEVESIASARSLVSQEKEKKDGVVLIVDLGAQRTSFIMVVKGSPYFTSSIPFSSESINDAISKGLNLDSIEAEKAKIAHGIESENENPIYGVVKSLLENLVQEIEKTADFYGELSQEKTEIEKIVLCGGGSNMKGLVPFLTKRLGREVELGNPWINLKMGRNLPIIDRESASRYATVIGLALRGINYNND
jgi:type IV pilus assembly protein PilM